MMMGLVGAVIGFSAAGCSDSAEVSCDSTSDCFSGEVCQDQICVSEADDDGAQNQTSPGNNGDDVDAGNNSPTVAENYDEDHENDAGGHDGGAEDNDETDANNDNDGEPKSCSFSASGEHSCSSGHSDLQSAHGALTLLPEGMDGVGCTGSYGELSEGFESFEDETWLIQACPDNTQRLRFSLQRCMNNTFPAFLRLEPVEDICPLDGPYVSISLTRETSNQLAECGEQDHNCYFEKDLDDGSFGWVIKPENTSVYSGYSWNVNVHVEAKPDAYFEYKVTASVPPFP